MSESTVSNISHYSQGSPLLGYAKEVLPYLTLGLVSYIFKRNLDEVNLQLDRSMALIDALQEQVTTLTRQVDKLSKQRPSRRRSPPPMVIPDDFDFDSDSNESFAVHADPILDDDSVDDEVEIGKGTDESMEDAELAAELALIQQSNIDSRNSSNT